MSCWQDGSPDADILVVGMAPGREELKEDRPFVGPSGRLLWAILKKAGIDRGDCYILNTIAEWPTDTTGDPTDAQLDAHWDAFDGAARDFRGRFVVLLGGTALRRYCGFRGSKQGINEWRGYLVSPDRTGSVVRSTTAVVPYKSSGKGHKKGDPRTVKIQVNCPWPLGPNVETIIPTLHPAGVLRTGLAAAPLLAADLRRLGRARAGELVRVREHYDVAATIPSRGRMVAVDIETGTTTEGMITRVGFATDTGAWTRHWDEGTRDVTSAILADPTRIVIGQNIGAFDYPRLKLAGCEIKGEIRDVMLSAAMLQPDLPKGLNSLASQYLDCERWKHLSDEDPIKYNAIDVIRTYELWERHEKLLAQNGQLSLYTDRICGALKDLAKMSEVGIRVDVEGQRRWIAELERTAMGQLAEWNSKTGNVNLSSPIQLKKYFKSLGVELRLNKYGAESTDKLALADMKSDYPEHAEMIDLLMATRHTLKDLSTYAKTEVSHDGRVHAQFLPAYKDTEGNGKGLAGTWRLTAKEPNLYNQPPIARRIYIPDEGMCFIGADYSQLEARILAGLSGDDALQAACEGGIHDRNAELLGVDKVRAKNGFYGWSYLAGARTLQNTFKQNGYKLKLEECQALLDGFNSLYQKAAGYRVAELAVARSKRYIENPFGLRRYFPHQTFPAPDAMATKIQSTGAIMMWTIIPQMTKAAESFNGNLLLSVYDDALWQVPLEHKDAALEALTDIMQQEFNEVAPGFRVPVSKKWSPTSWGAMEELH